MFVLELGKTLCVTGYLSMPAAFTSFLFLIFAVSSNVISRGICDLVIFYMMTLLDSTVRFNLLVGGSIRTEVNDCFPFSYVFQYRGYTVN